MPDALYSFQNSIHYKKTLVSFCSKYQQRLPYDLLSSLANSLLDGTVFEIVRSLQEVQQLEERHLHTQRVKLVNDHKGLALIRKRKSKNNKEFCSTCFNIMMMYYNDDDEDEDEF